MVALLIASCLAGAVAIFGTKLLMDVLIARGVGQPIHEDVPEGHTIKAGTPPMGGLAIVGAAAIAAVLAAAQPGDVVVIAGKGHEAVQVVGERSLAFDDREVARDALRALRGSRAW